MCQRMSKASPIEFLYLSGYGLKTTVRCHGGKSVLYYEDLDLGQRDSFSKTISETDVVLFAGITGDFNPLHVDRVQAADGRFGERVAHGMLSASVLCAVYGMRLPGPGTIQIEQHLTFLAPVRIGDTVTAHVEVIELAANGRVKLRSWCTRQDDVVVLDGEALMLVPSRARGGREPQ